MIGNGRRTVRQRQRVASTSCVAAVKADLTAEIAVVRDGVRRRLDQQRGESPARTLLQIAGMMTVDPVVLGGAVAGLVTLQLTSLGILVAVLRFFYDEAGSRNGRSW